jgi:cellulose synthase/poly-beta-1,6-N-acetylglucosamine synthase-like glycosyltransferase
LTDKHTRVFAQRHGDVCALSRFKCFSLRQVVFYFLLCPSALLLGFIRDPKITFTVLTFALCGLYGMVVLFRLAGVLLALARSCEHRINPLETQALADADLPVYTILVPMYKEPEIAQKIARTVTSLDYPVDKLDVKLLLEEDDLQTRAKINEVLASLPPCVEVILAPVVPKGQPRTKPRACNWGLDCARGEFLVIFDAEDQPEPDQLKKAVVAFRQLEAAGKKNVVCLQAKLNYFNARQNSLTRFFTLEYTNWFDLFLPGLHACKTPIPLGGTSNHFRTEVLKRVGGWDPFNVTEDCDLGIRLARQGYSTEVLESTTWEEANCRTGNWIRQRSRWIKGYFQTHLVHTRDAVLPMLGMAAVFALLFYSYNFEPDARFGPRVAWWAKSLQAACAVLAGLSLLCALVSIGQLLVKKHRRFGEGPLTPWKALAFRFTVGGMSAMLLLNIAFWCVACAYLFRGPISSALPEGFGEQRLPWDDSSTVRETVRDWKLYYTEVTVKGYEGVTVWNTVRDYTRGQLSTKEAGMQLHVIDGWSLVSQLFYPVAVMLFMANLIFVLLGLVSCHKRGLWDLFPHALLMPFYWILISIAAIKGFLQLFTNPWYWEKTSHGLTHPEPVAPLAPPAPPAPPLNPASPVGTLADGREKPV